jgi:hypothetical protein
MVEGTKIELARTEAYLAKGRWNRGTIRDSDIGQGTESPQEALELLFPRYQVSEYLGVRLGLLNSPKRFNQPRWSCLRIISEGNVRGSVMDLDKNAARYALRRPTKRTFSRLREEAGIIVNDFLPYIEHAVRSSGRNTSEYRQAVAEIHEAFKNLRLI